MFRLTCSLPHKLQCQLNMAWIRNLGVSRFAWDYTAEVGTTKVVVELADAIREVIREIEHLDAELHIYPLSEFRQLVERYVHGWRRVQPDRWVPERSEP